MNSYLKLKRYALLCSILAMFIFSALYFANQKKGYFMDEIFSFQLANGNIYIQSNPNLWNRWGDSKEFIYQRITTKDNDRFNYKKIYKLMPRDPNPPLYFFLLHTISSFYPGSHSKWLGIFPNIVFFLVTLYLIYKIGLELCGDTFYAFAACCLWGFSTASMSFLVYVRAYMLLALICSASFYAHVLLIKKRFLYSILFAIFVLSVLGILTHYYYLFFAFFLSTFCSLFWFKSRNIRRFFVYASIMLSALLFCAILNPAMLSWLTASRVSRRAAAQLINTAVFWPHFKSYVFLLDKGLLGSSLIYIITFVLISYVVIFIKKYNISRNTSHINDLVNHENSFNSYFLFFITGIVPTCFLLAIAWVAPFQTDRYIFCTYPIISIFIILIFKWTAEIISGKSRAIRLCFVFMAIVIITSRSYLFGNVQYLYPEAVICESIAHKYANTPAIYLVGDKKLRWLINSDLLILQKHNLVYFSELEQIRNLNRALTEVDITKGIVVYINKGYIKNFNQDRILNDLKIALHASNYKRLFQNNATAYYFD